MLRVVAIISMVGVAYAARQVNNCIESEHNCMTCAGYSWCETAQKCLRLWEEACPEADYFIPPPPPEYPDHELVQF